MSGHLGFAGVVVSPVLDLGDHHHLLLPPLAVLARVAGVDHLLDQQQHDGVNIALTQTENREKNNISKLKPIKI